MARPAADGTLERLTRAPFMAITILNTNKARNLLGKQDLHKLVAITYIQYVWSGNRRSNHVLRTEPRHTLRKERKQHHNQLQQEDCGDRPYEVCYEQVLDEQEGHQSQIQFIPNHKSNNRNREKNETF